ncbi:unnamed protein product [Chrysoparadoxa australica]
MEQPSGYYNMGTPTGGSHIPAVADKSREATTHTGHLPPTPQQHSSPQPPLIQSHSASLLNEREVVRKAGKEKVNEFLASHSCYDLLTHSGKVVVFDASIPIQLAFYALVEHDMQAAPLWDSSQRRFVGLMTVTDFIDILRHYSHRGVPVEQLAAKSIMEVLSEPEGQRLHQDEFVHVDAEAPLSHASGLFQNRNIKFLPIMVPGEPGVFALISHVEILEFLVTTFREQRRLFDNPISELQIGFFGDSVITVHQDARLHEVLDTMELHGIGAVPIVDQNGRVVNIYSRSDITFLATAADPDGVLRNLDCKLTDILAQPGNEGLRDRLITCSPSDTLQMIFEKFAEVKFKRIVCVDSNFKCKGLISVSDLLAYFLV